MQNILCTSGWKICQLLKAILAHGSDCLKEWNFWFLARLSERANTISIRNRSNSLLSLIIVGIYYLFLSFTVFFFLFLFFVSLFVIRRLLQQLNAYAPGAQSKEKSAKTASTQGSEADYVTYELYYRPEQAQFSKNARVSSWILCLIRR